MKDNKRIVFFVTLLIGGTLTFGFWSLYHFNKVFSNLDELSRDGVVYKTQKNIIASTTLNTDLSTTTIVSEDVGFKFIFPENKTDVYKGCQYKISWKSLSKINYIELSLVDAGTKEVIGPIAGGVPKNLSGSDLLDFSWKVGNVWPGEYYILISNINNNPVREKTKIINIKEIPEGENLENFCQ